MDQGPNSSRAPQEADPPTDECGGAWFQAVFHQSGDCLLLVSVQGEIARANATAGRELFGPAGVPDGAGLAEFIEPRDWEAFVRVAGREQWRGRWRWRLGPGSTVLYEVDLTPLPARPPKAGRWVLARLGHGTGFRPDLGPEVGENFSLAFGLSPVALCLTALDDGRFLEVNDALCRMVGLPREELLTRSPEALGFWPNAEQRKRFLDTLESRRSIRDLEVGVRDRWGRRRWMLLSAELLVMGDRTCIFSAVTDVTSIRRATRLIQAQRDLALELAAASRPEEVAGPCLETALRISGMDSGVIYLADAATGDFHLAKHTGFKQEFVEAVRRRPAETLHRDPIGGRRPFYWLRGSPHPAGMPDIDREGLQSLALIPIHYEGRAVGSLGVASHRPLPIPGATKRALETMAAHLGSVIARSQAEQALRASEEHLRSLFTNARDFAVYRLQSDPDEPFGLRVVFASPSMKELLGIEHPEDLMEWARNVHPEDLPQVLEANLRAFETRRFEAKARIVDPVDGRIRWLSGVSSGVVDPVSGVHYINGLIIDISRNEEARQSLDAYQGRLRALALQLSRVEENQRRALATDLHDGVGQLLAVAKLRLQDVMAFQAGPDLAGPLSEVQGLIDQMIALTRTVTAELSPPVLYDLGLEAALEWLAERTQAEHGLPLDLQFQDRPIVLDEDMRVMLFRAVRELVYNVVKHARASRAVVSLELQGGRVVIRVSDDGVGFQDARTAMRAAADQGFGLFSIRDRMEYLGGAMWVDPAPGRGAAVNLIAPTSLKSRIKAD